MISSGPLPIPIFKRRSKWCLFGTVLVHSTVCRYNRSFILLIFFLARFWGIIDQLKILFLCIHCVTQGPHYLDVLTLLTTSWLVVRSNNNGYYLLSNYNVPEHYKHMYVCIYIYLHLFTYINPYPAMHIQCMKTVTDTKGKYIYFLKLITLSQISLPINCEHQCVSI